MNEHQRARLSHYVLGIACLCLMLTCRVQNFQQNAIEVKRGQTVEERARWAEAFVTEERFERLKVQLKERLPQLTDTQLSQLGLRWNQTTFQSFTGQGSSTTVTIIVVVGTDGTFDPAPILAAAAAILEPEINGPPAVAPISKAGP